jgi:hypothetical protein
MGAIVEIEDGDEAILGRTLGDSVEVVVKNEARE